MNGGSKAVIRTPGFFPRAPLSGFKAPQTTIHTAEYMSQATYFAFFLLYQHHLHSGSIRASVVSPYLVFLAFDAFSPQCLQCLQGLKCPSLVRKELLC